MVELAMTISSDPSSINAQSSLSPAPQFVNFEAYLAAKPSELPEGRYEYWDGALVPIMSESELNDAIANYLFLVLVTSGIGARLVRPHSCEVEVPGQPRTRLPDLTVLDEVHLPLIQRRLTMTRDMPPPRMIAEVVSPGDENSDNYKRDYHDKARQYADIGVMEYWLVDPARSFVLVGRLINGAYQFERFQGEDAIASPTFPDLNVTAQQVLNANR